MDGLLIIDKPAGITSHDVVARVRRSLGTRRVGHTGTLDPFATGVMVILVGKATRLARFLDKDEKEYEATVRFGFETDTGDVTGTPKSGTQGPKPVLAAAIQEVLPQFTGEIEQTPPMYSAKKVAGKKLYEHARRGETIEREARPVTIGKLDMLGVAGDDTARLRVVCSAGTYVRTLAEDIGRALGTAAHLTALRRTRAGRFGLSQSLTLDDLSVEDLLPIDSAVSHLGSITLAADRVERTKSGVSSRIDAPTFDDGDALRMLDDGGQLIAIGMYDADETAVKPKVVLV